MNYDKGHTREPRPFFLPLEDLVLGSKWLKIFISTLPDDGTYIVRDFSGAIDRFHDTFLPAPKLRDEIPLFDYPWMRYVCFCEDTMLFHTTTALFMW